MDPLARKLGDKAAQAIRQQVKDISEEVKEIPKSGKSQITGEEETIEDHSDGKKQSTQTGKQQLLTLLRGSKKQTNKPQNTSTTTPPTSGNSDDKPKQQSYDYLDRDIDKARKEREEKERQRLTQQQEETIQKPQEERAFTVPRGRKTRGLKNPMQRKGEKKNELGRTAKG